MVRNKPIRAFLILMNTALVIIIPLVSCMYGQAGTLNGGAPDGPYREAIERRGREHALRSVRKAPNDSRPDNTSNRQMLDRLNEDLKRLQIIRLGMVRDIRQGKPFEYRRLSEDANEIKKLATRLRNSLAVFEEKADDPPSTEAAELDKEKIQDAAWMLCLEISRFTENPMFRSHGAYNVRHAAEAGKALNTVIALSINIRSSAEKLRTSDK